MRFWKTTGMMALALSATAPSAQAQPLPQRIYAVKLAVHDVQLTTRFYQLLGMKAGRQHNEWETELTWDEPTQGTAIIMVREGDNARFHVTRGGATLVFMLPDVPAALMRLRGAGFAVPGEPRVTAQSTIIMIQDPDGNWLELAGPGSGAATH